MLPEFALFALITAFGVALLSAPIAFLSKQPEVFAQRYLRHATMLNTLLVAIAFIGLVLCFARNDFSVAYVAANSNSKLPMIYRLTATWGGHEGSILLWLFVLCLWSASVAWFGRQLPALLHTRALGVLLLINIGFAAFILFTSNPFQRALPPLADGRDLNPLLQDPGMVIHPPLLYLGYVGFSVAFAFSIAALLTGIQDKQWARWLRPWTLAAWGFLTSGIALGSFWAYYELGWGGWWFWDPVENASFMPWLIGTALIHSLNVSDRRGELMGWSLLLGLVAFLLSLLGTFLVRSGVVTSVHAFASDPARGTFILVFLAVCTGSALYLYATRAPAARPRPSYDLLSREGLLHLGNLVLALVTATVLLGTLYPIAYDALGLGKLSVGEPYFNAVFIPLMLPLLLMMGIGTLSTWHRAAARPLLKRLLIPAVAAIIAAVLARWLMGRLGPTSILGVLAAAWIAASCLRALFERLRAKLKFNLSFVAMLLGHTGMAVSIIGITFVSSFGSTQERRMTLGETVELAGRQFTLEAMEPLQGPNYRGARAIFRVQDGERTLTLKPEKRIYLVQGMPMTEAAIHRSVTRDLYIALGENAAPSADDAGRPAWGVRIQVKPFVNWIWSGCVLMALAAFAAMTDRRYRQRAEAPAGAAVMPLAAAGEN